MTLYEIVLVSIGTAGVSVFLYCTWSGIAELRRRDRMRGKSGGDGEP